MDFTRKAIVTAIVGSFPLIVAAIINMAIEQARAEQKITDIKEEFLRTVKAIDRRLSTIEGHIYEKNK